MFDIGMWELMVIGIVMLLVVGPKELPGMLRTIGKYAGMLKRQASEFRAQFDEAIRESEFSDIKKEMEEIGQETEASLREGENALTEDLAQFDDHSNLDDDDYDLSGEDTGEDTGKDIDAAAGRLDEPAGQSADSSPVGSDEPRSTQPSSNDGNRGAGATSPANGSTDSPPDTRKEFSGEFVPGELIDDGDLPTTKNIHVNGKDSH